MGLIELSLYALDLEEMRQFYCAILGLREVEPGWTDRLAVEAGSECSPLLVCSIYKEA